MKTLLISLALMMTAASLQASAQAIVFNKVLTDITQISTLNKFQVAKDSGLPLNIRSAYVQVRSLGDQARSIGLTLNPAFDCTAGKMCIMMMPIPVNMQFPVIEESQNECGIKTFVAVNSARTNEGNSIRVTVIDNTQNTCPTFVALAPTELIYETQNLDASKVTQSVMTGAKLEIQTSNNGEM